MKINRLRIALAVLVVALIFGVFTLLFWDFVRDTIVVPIYYVLWIGGLVLNSIPQTIFAALLALIGLLIGLNTLASLPRKPDAAAPVYRVTAPETRYQHWRRLADNLAISRFSRNLFISDSRKLILSILAYEQGLDVTEIAALIKTDALELPAGIQTLFERNELQEILAVSPLERLIGRLRRLRERVAPGRPAVQANSQVDPLIADVMNFIEQHLEQRDAGSSTES